MVVVKKYVPERGELVWITLDPSLGHEQKGRRPALVVSPRAYNAKSGLALVCPVTSHIKDYPFEVRCMVQNTESVILVDQIRSIDWKMRKVSKILKASPRVLQEVELLLGKLLGLG
jgi:mRNA interferase MazF